MTPTEHSTLEKIFQLTGKRIRLQRWEKIEAHIISDTGVMLMIDTYKVRVLVREDRYEAHGSRILSWSRNTTEQKFKLSVDTTTWDESFVPETFQNWHGSDWVPTAEFPTDRHFADACYRPGTDTHPMDNFDRTALTPAANPRMARHWKIEL